MSGGAMMGSLAAGVGEGIVNNMFAKDNARWSLYQQNRMMEKQNAMNNANIANAPQKQVEGLRMAGFNPAMMNGAGSSAPATVSQGNADMPQTVPFDLVNEFGLMEAQKENVEAQTAKTLEEKRGVEQQNDIVDAANDAAVQGYLADWNREQEDLTKARDANEVGSEQWNKLDGRIKELEKMKAKITDPSYKGAVGIATGTEAARKETRDRARRLHEYLTGHMDNAVAEKELGNGTVAALAGMKKQNAEKLAQDIKKVKQDIAESESREELNDQTVLKLQKDIEKIGDEILRAHLNDPNWIKRYLGVDSEEWKNYTDTQWRNAAFEVGKNVITGAATGGAIGAANAMLRNAGNKVEPRSDYDWEGSGYEDGNINRNWKHWSPDNPHGIGDKPQGVSDFDWNNMQKRANQAGKKRR